MKGFVNKDRRTDLEKEYDRAVERLKTFEIGTKQYDECLTFVERLRELVTDEKSCKKTVSPDAIVGLIGGAVQIGLVLGHERLHNITSKALGFVSKPRVK